MQADTTHAHSTHIHTNRDVLDPSAQDAPLPQALTSMSAERAAVLLLEIQATLQHMLTSSCSAPVAMPVRAVVLFAAAVTAIGRDPATAVWGACGQGPLEGKRGPLEGKKGPLKGKRGSPDY